MTYDIKAIKAYIKDFVTSTESGKNKNLYINESYMNRNSLIYHDKSVYKRVNKEWTKIFNVTFNRSTRKTDLYYKVTSVNLQPV